MTIPFTSMLAQKKLRPVRSEPPSSVGIVISLPESGQPNVTNFSFIVTNGKAGASPTVRQGQFCVVYGNGGCTIGRIDQIFTRNDYFANYETVKNFENAQLDLRNFFPSNEWENHIAGVRVFGRIKAQGPEDQLRQPENFKRIEKSGFPVKPGSKIYVLEGEALANFLGINTSGLNIGALKFQNLEMQVDLNRLFNKHVAILAQSGAGKSYLISVLLEELLGRPQELGTPAMVLIDVHGEYHFLTEGISKNIPKNPEDNQDYRFESSELEIYDGFASRVADKVDHYNASFLQISVPEMGEYDFQRYQPGISVAQIRELRKAIKLCRSKFKKEGYDIMDLISTLNDDPDINGKVRDTLVSWLNDLHHLKIFSKFQAPSNHDLARLGRLAIIDLTSMISLRKKQILVHYFTSRLFYARRRKIIPPFILFLEEAHQFIPEAGSTKAIAKSIFETIAREGRKFFAQLVLISQRPVHLSTTVLSQCNSQIILRITNPYDLDHVRKTSEAITTDTSKIISSLPTGNALIMGAAINIPAFFKVRKRKIIQAHSEESLEQVCQSFIKNDALSVLRAKVRKTEPVPFTGTELLDLEIVK